MISVDWQVLEIGNCDSDGNGSKLQVASGNQSLKWNVQHSNIDLKYCKLYLKKFVYDFEWKGNVNLSLSSPIINRLFLSLEGFSGTKG
jgi:hypothetical protein